MVALAYSPKPLDRENFSPQFAGLYRSVIPFIEIDSIFHDRRSEFLEMRCSISELGPRGQRLRASLGDCQWAGKTTSAAGRFSPKTRRRAVAPSSWFPPQLIFRRAEHLYCVFP